MTKDDRVLDFIHCNPGTTQMAVIEAFGHGFFDSTPRYGSQRKASTIIARLRSKGLIQDVGGRCLTCHRALTRGSRNVRHFVTDEGVAHLLKIGITTKAS